MHVELIFVCGVGGGSHFILLRVAVQLSQHHMLKRLLSPSNGLGTLVGNHWTIDMRVYFGALRSVPLLCMPVFMPGPH